MELVEIYRQLACDLQKLTFSQPVAFVYNPIIYATEPHDLYLRRYGASPKEAIFLGMNPGPWGMAQTGVPFGEIKHVKNWLQIEGNVEKPPAEHPKKKVEGFACRRSEISGLRLWGLFQERFITPDTFFSRFFVLNYCPLLFLDTEGRNITPDKLKNVERVLLQELCSRAFRAAVLKLAPSKVIGVGNFAQLQAEDALRGLNVEILKIAHPSPANPNANRNWSELVLKQLAEQGLVF